MLKQVSLLGFCLLFLLWLAACGGGGSSAEGGSNDDGGNNNDNGSFTGQTIEINATSYDNEVFLDLATGAVLTSTDIADPATSMLWDLAFQRFNLRLNGGVGGAKGVKGYATASDSDFYDAEGNPLVDQFINATAESELNDLLTTTTRPDDTAWITDSLRPAIVGDGSADGWWLYNPVDRTVSANSAAFWVIRHNTGDAYSKVNITAIDQANRAVAFAFARQLTGSSAFADSTDIYTITLGAAGGLACLDVDTLAEVSCDLSADWDVKLLIEGRTWALYTNGGVSGSGEAAAFGSMDEATVNSFSAGNQVPTWTADSQGGVFSDHPWYAYSLQGNNRLWPNYKVYLIDVAGIIYRLQVLSYYNAAGASAFVTVRYDVMP